MIRRNQLTRLCILIFALLSLFWSYSSFATPEIDADGEIIWESLGPEGGSLFSVAVSPNFDTDGMVLVGGRNHSAIIRTTDGGDSWALNQRGGPTGHVVGIAFSPHFDSDSTAFAATGNGVFRSTSGASPFSWENLTEHLVEKIAAVALSSGFGDSDPNTTDTVFAAAEDDGVWRSDDGGGNWVDTSSNLFELLTDEISSIAISPAVGDPNSPADDIVLVGTEDDGIIRSVNGGATWVEADASSPVRVNEIRMSPDFLTDQTVYAASEDFGMFISTDAGASWTPINSGIERTDLDFRAIAISPSFSTDDTLFIGGDHGLFRSTDKGANWVSAGTTFTRVRIQDIATTPGFLFSESSTDKAVYAVTESFGAFRSTDGGNTWTAVNNGLIAIDVHDVEASPNFDVDQIVLVATEDASLFRSEDSGSTWEQIFLDDLDVNDITYSPRFSSDQTVFAATDGEVERSLDRGKTWEVLHKFGNDVDAVAISPAYGDQDPQTDDILFAGTEDEGVFKSIDGGQNWAPVNNGLPGSVEITALVISPDFTVDGTIFAGTDDHNVYRSRDGGENWVFVGDEITDDENKGMVISPDYANDHTIFVGGDDAGVFRSTDGGDTWTNINQGVSALFHIRSLGISPNFATDNTLFAGGGSGVFRSLNRGESWQPIVGGLIDDRVESISVVASPLEDALTVFAGMPGGGVFRLDGEPMVIPIADFIWEPGAGIAPVTIQFTDVSIRNPTSWVWDFDTDVDSSGDGIPDNDVESTEQNPTHTFEEPGIFEVKLTVSNDFGVDSRSRMLQVHDDTAFLIRVLDEDGAPIQNAAVSLYLDDGSGELDGQSFGSTDDQGFAVLSKPPPGDGVVSAVSRDHGLFVVKETTIPPPELIVLTPDGTIPVSFETIGLDGLPMRRANRISLNIGEGSPFSIGFKSDDTGIFPEIRVTPYTYNAFLASGDGYLLGKLGVVVDETNSNILFDARAMETSDVKIKAHGFDNWAMSASHIKGRPGAIVDHRDGIMTISALTWTSITVFLVMDLDEFNEIWEYLVPIFGRKNIDIPSGELLAVDAGGGFVLELVPRQTLYDSGDFASFDFGLSDLFGNSITQVDLSNVGQPIVLTIDPHLLVRAPDGTVIFDDDVQLFFGNQGFQIPSDASSGLYSATLSIETHTGEFVETVYFVVSELIFNPLETNTNTATPLDGVVVSTGTGDPVEMMVTIPPGAVSVDTEITVESIDVNSNNLRPLLGSTRFLSRAFKLTPEGQTFDETIELVVTYAEGEASKSGVISPLLYNPDSVTFDEVADCVDVDDPEPNPCVSHRDLTNNQIFIRSNQFSIYAFEEESLLVCGDQNNDQVVDILDVVINLMIVIGLITPSDEQNILGDLDQSAGIGLGDAMIGLRHLVGANPTLTCGP